MERALRALGMAALVIALLLLFVVVGVVVVMAYLGGSTP